MRIAFCFPGQGSQDVGMGRAIAERFPEARAVYDEASEAVGYDVAQVCFEGPIEKLTRTDVQQPALVATSLACLRAVDTLGIKPDFVVGHSVGEYSALAAAASLPDRDAIALVQERGRAMAEAADRHPGAMAAVIGLDDSVVEELCAGIENVWPANYNCPGQVVVSGENAAVDQIIEEASALGARKTVKLRVSGAFHSPLVEGAADILRPALEEVSFSNPVTPKQPQLALYFYGQDRWALGSKVTLVSSREQVLPGEDADAAAVIQNVFTRNGMTILNKSRAASVERAGDGVLVTLADGRTVEGSHALMAVGSVPNTAGIGLEEAGVQLTDSGHIRVNRVARTSIPSIYAAGDCSDFLPLASVASMQGRTAVFHAMGDAVSPTELRNVTSNIFTQPEVATVGWSQKQIEDGIAQGSRTTLMTQVPQQWRNLRDASRVADVATWRGAGVHAVAGIGHPERFFALLRAQGVVAAEHAFADHHAFVAADFAWPGATAILMTQKDAVKCAAFADERFWYLPVRASIDPALVALVEHKIRGSQTA